MTFDSLHFQLQQVTAGVIAALHKNGGGAHSNAGIVDLGDATVVFDTFLTPNAGEDLRRAAESLTAHGVSWVVYSHFHLDHVFGTQAFGGAPIISTAVTRQLLQENSQPLLPAWRKNPAPLVDAIKQMEDRQKNDPDPQVRAGLEMQIAFDRSLLEALPGSQLCMPDHTFTGKLSIHGTERTAELISVGTAHTTGDLVMVIPEARTAFLGDVGFFHTMPFTYWGDPAGWIRVIDELVAMEIDYFVPGHGPVGTRAEMAETRAYLQVLLDMAAEARAKKLALAEAVRMPIPAPFCNWDDPWARLMLEDNMTKLLS